METADSGSRLDVLLVEDSPRIAERLRELLTQEQGVHVVATVEDEPGAIRALREMHVDLLILDLQLKTGTGFGVLESVGARRPRTIVMTNYALPQYRERAQRLGVDHFLNKEKDFHRLPQIVAEMRAGQGRAGRNQPAGPG
jgi:DNA-binding NarL/FixJ family response regulator